MQWSQASGIATRQFICGHCGDKVASVSGFLAQAGPVVGAPVGCIYICPGCTRPNYFEGPSQLPGVAPGNEVAHLPADIKALYEEARRSAGAGAHTGSVLACRKLLMNIAVAQGARPGESFVSYVDYLATSGYIPPNGRGWVDHIRSKGNEATHEIHLMTVSDSSELIAFAEMLQKFIFEFPAKIPTTPTPT